MYMYMLSEKKQYQILYDEFLISSFSVFAQTERPRDR